MSEYKRNQVEEAISAEFEPHASEPSSELRTQLKRLLETDRAKGRTPRSQSPEAANYAFYRSEPPGTGTEVMFSDYEAFALFEALQIMAHGWPQGFAVSILRRVRDKLEPHHSRILKLDERALFDQDVIRRNAKAGDLAFGNTAPVLLTILSKRGSTATEEPLACEICQGPKEAMEWVRSAGGLNHGPFTMFELVSPAHALAKALARTEPRARGRGN